MNLTGSMSGLTKPVADIYKGMPKLETLGLETFNPDATGGDAPALKAPALKTTTRKTQTRAYSFFEFWPVQLIYIPVIFQWLWLALRYRSLSLPLIANPAIPLSGFVGESKTAVLNLAGDHARSYIAPFITLYNDAGLSVSERTSIAIYKLQQANIKFPVVAKPDIGCRGAGVQVIRQAQELEHYLQQFPVNSDLLLQHKVPLEAEAGIFYIREPGTSEGYIFSITLKYAPYVVGDGQRTLKQLIKQDPRASKISHLYLKRHQDKLDNIIGDQQAYRLAFAGSHCKGSIFRNGSELITKELAQAFDKIADDIDGFYYGRIDVRFENTEKLKKGKGFKILEINGASSEATHIWDRDTRLQAVYQTLFHQYRVLFKIGDLNRKSGHKPASLWQLLRAYLRERKLVGQYPETD